MKKLRNRILSATALAAYFGMSFAAVNPITVTYLNGSSNFVTGNSGTENYVVAVNSGVIPPNVPLAFHLQSTGSSSGLTATQQITGPSPCINPSTLCSSTFSLSAGQSCCLAFTLTSNIAGNYTMRPIISTTPPAYSAEAPSVTTISITSTPPGTAILSVRPSLGLSVNCQPSSTCTTEQNAALTGQARTLTIENTGLDTATGLAISYPTFPTGTQHTTNCGSALGAGDTCIITITPGDTATSDCSTGIVPDPGIITISANNAAPVTSGVVVLTYGCIYQGGYIYAVDDTYATAPSGKSIAGKVAALTDSVLGPTNPSQGTPNWGGFGCDIGASLWDNNPEGANNGSANSAAIVSALTTNYSSGSCRSSLTQPVALMDYAAGSCSQYTTSSDMGLTWYLPSICELSGTSPSSNCNAGTTSMLNQLWLLTPAVGGFAVPAGFYWSSTEDFPGVSFGAWGQQFSAGGNQVRNIKTFILGVRCSRALTI